MPLIPPDAGYILVYVLGLCAVLWYARRRSERTRSLFLTGWNYLYAVFLLTVLRCQDGTSVSVFEAAARSLYEAAAAITFQGDVSEIGPWTTLVFFVMSLGTLYTVLVLILRQVLDRTVRRWRLRRAKEVYVLCGGKEDAAVLLEDLRRHVERAAAVWIPYTEGEEAGDLSALPRGWDFLGSIGREDGRPCHIVLLPDAPGSAFRRLRELDAAEAAKADPGDPPRFHVTAVLDDTLLRLEDLRLPHLDAYLVSREALSVKEVLSAHRPLSLLRGRDPGTIEDGVYVPSRPFALCAAGFDALSRAFLLAAYEETAFETAAPDRRGLDAVILGTDRAPWDAFLQDFPALSSDDQIRWEQEEDLETALFRLLEERTAGLDEVLISTGDTARDTDMAVRAVRLFRRMGLSPQERPFLVVALHERADSAVSLLGDEERVAFLRDDRSLYTYDALIGRALDRSAEEIHRRYHRKALISPAWRELSTYTQESDRAAAWDIPNKLLLAQGTDGPGVDREAAAERLARYEHRRWTAYHAAHGWQVLPAAGLTAEERASFVTKRPDERRHICMVDWDGLDALPQREPGLLKKYDYENVRELLESRTR